MLLQYNPVIIPIPYDSGPSAPMTDNDAHVLLSIWIAIHVLFLLVYLISLSRMFFMDKEDRNLENFLECIGLADNMNFMELVSILFGVFIILPDVIGIIGYFIYHLF